MHVYLAYLAAVVAALAAAFGPIQALWLFVWDWAGHPDLKIQGPLIAAVVAVSVFVLTRIVDLMLRWQDRISIRQRLVLGLYAEIKSNVSEIEEFVPVSAGGAPSDAAIKPVLDKVAAEAAKRAAGEGLERPVFRPLIVITESSRFFLASAALVPELKTAVLSPVMEFYRALEELEKRQEALESKAYETISPASQAATVRDVWNTANAARVYGRHALDEIERAYPQRWMAKLRSAESRMPTPERR